MIPIVNVDIMTPGGGKVVGFGKRYSIHRLFVVRGFHGAHSYSLSSDRLGSDVQLDESQSPFRRKESRKRRGSHRRGTCTIPSRLYTVLV